MRASFRRTSEKSAKPSSRVRFPPSPQLRANRQIPRTNGRGSLDLCRATSSRHAGFRGIWRGRDRSPLTKGRSLRDRSLPGCGDQVAMRDTLVRLDGAALPEPGALIEVGETRLLTELLGGPRRVHMELPRLNSFVCGMPFVDEEALGGRGRELSRGATLLQVASIALRRRASSTSPQKPPRSRRPPPWRQSQNREGGLHDLIGSETSVGRA
jgi:hypothetical protein